MFLYTNPPKATSFSANYPIHFVCADLHRQYNFETMFSNKPLFKMFVCLCKSIRDQYCSKSVPSNISSDFAQEDKLFFKS